MHIAWAQLHVHEQNLPFADFRKSRGKPSGQGRGASAFGKTGHTHQLRFVSHLVAFKVEVQPVPDSFGERADEVFAVPRSEMRSVCSLLRQRQLAAGILWAGQCSSIRATQRNGEKERNTQMSFQFRSRL